LADLFGCDVPVVTDSGTLSFEWRDGPILNAIKTGQWVLLDEMNLASQSILEGMNACFDHRRQLFIPELSRTFKIDGNAVQKTRFFACQNPCSQGGNRRKLPKSFVNRFTQIYVAQMTASDFSVVLKCSFEAQLSDEVIQKMVDLNSLIAKKMAEDAQFAAKGSPFEFNLRDLLRWAQLTVESGGDIAYGFDLLYVWRLRSNADRLKVSDFVVVETNQDLSEDRFMKLLSSQMQLLEKLAVCVRMNWLTLLVGPCGCGKSTTVRNLASLVGKNLCTMRLTSESDSLELLGSFEQVLAVCFSILL
uniref:AAA_6 domain-containing protein n=1 Tax=Gongylonema pulchrum TaxID=637853 RepID=A0A183EB49_9BILA